MATAPKLPPVTPVLAHHDQPSALHEESDEERDPILRKPQPPQAPLPEEARNQPAPTRRRRG